MHHISEASVLTKKVITDCVRQFCAVVTNLLSGACDIPRAYNNTWFYNFTNMPQFILTDLINTEQIELKCNHPLL